MYQIHFIWPILFVKVHCLSWNKWGFTLSYGIKYVAIFIPHSKWQLVYQVLFRGSWHSIEVWEVDTFAMWGLVEATLVGFEQIFCSQDITLTDICKCPNINVLIAPGKFISSSPHIHVILPKLSWNNTFIVFLFRILNKKESHADSL